MSYSKYRNIKVTIDGITFDSKREAEFYQQLKMLLRSGAIAKFECQPVFLLQDGFSKNGKKFAPIKYIADFMVTEKNGSLTVYDVKPFDLYEKRFLLTKEFKLKWKLFERVYPELSITLV